MRVSIRLAERAYLGRRSTGRGWRMIVQLISASIKPEHRDRWLEVIERNAVRTRAEEGCEGYRSPRISRRPIPS